MDNLRYISLQYIKGDNYEKIQCFKYEEIMELLVYIKESRDYSKERLKDLKDSKEKEKCLVGESFLNDLVNYYNFTDIRDAIDDITGGNIVIGDKKNKDKLMKTLDELIELIRSAGNQQPRNIFTTNTVINDKAEKFNEFVKLYNILFKKQTSHTFHTYDNTTYNTVYALTQAAAGQGQPAGLAEGAIITLDNFYNYLLLDKEEYGIKTENLKDRIIIALEDIIKYNDGMGEHLIMLFQTLKEVLIYEGERDTVWALLKIYRKICVSNIAIFDKLFTKTDISSIDDAFMIKSYAVFLDKLEKIKKSLEGKDLTKQERGLSNTLERLFDLYGINDPDGIIKDTEKSKYLYEHIVQ